jgi:hypothetical protein
MTTVATLWVKLGLDTKDYEKGLDKAQKGTKDASKKIDREAQSIGGFLAKNAAFIGAVSAAGAAVWDMTQAASDLSESVNKVNVVFGDSAQEIQDWSQTTATNIGISRQAALEAAGTYGNLFTSLGLTRDAAGDMSTSLVELAADMASFNNADPSEVLMALRSGLSGEIEPLKKYGIAMNEAIMKQKAFQMGLGDSVQALSEAEKLQVRYAIIMDQTTNAQGDFARTSDGLANTMRTLKAQFTDIKAILGEAFLPDIQQAATDLKVFSTWVKENIEDIKKWGGYLSWVTMLPSKLGHELAGLIRGEKGVAENAEEMGDAASGAAMQVDDLVPALSETTDATKEAEAAAKALTDAYKGILSTAFDLNRESTQFAEDEASRAQQLQDIAGEKVRLQMEQNAVQAAGNLDLAARNDFMLKQIELDNEHNDILKESAQAEEDLAKAHQRRIYDLVESRLAVDGLASGEFDYLQNLQVQMGLVSRADADKAIQISRDADQFVAAYAEQNDSVSSLKQTLDLIPANSPYRAQIVIETIGSIPSFSGIAAGGPFGGLHEQVNFSGPLMGGFAGGAENFTVPPGFPNDSFVAGFTSGEVLNVDRAGETNSTDNRQDITIIQNIYGPQDWDYYAQEIKERILR